MQIVSRRVSFAALNLDEEAQNGRAQYAISILELLPFHCIVFVISQLSSFIVGSL